MSVSPPVTWDGLNINPLVQRPDGVLPVVENVTGWYDTPDYSGNDVALVLADGSVRGPKTAAARTIVISGSAIGAPAALAVFRDQLVVRAAALLAADLAIPDAAGRLMTARVRCDSDGLKHTFDGPNLFTFQITVTATDPRLYGPWYSATALAAAASPTGWQYNVPASVAAWHPPGVMRMDVAAAGNRFAKAQSENLTVAPGDALVMTATAAAGFGAGGFALQLASADLSQYVTGATVNAAPGITVSLTLSWTVPAGVTQAVGRLQMTGPAGDGYVPAGTVSKTSLAQITRGGVVLNSTPTFATGIGPWTFQNGAAGTWEPQNVRTYRRQYAIAQLPNTVTLTNAGNAPAPVLATYTGDLGSSRLTDETTGNTIYLAPVAPGAQITVDTSTLNAWAAGGASRASYVGAGSVPLLIPPLSTVTWALYATGAGSVLLEWRPAWQ
jgi:hypothetical protein